MSALIFLCFCKRFRNLKSNFSSSVLWHFIVTDFKLLSLVSLWSDVWINLLSAYPLTYDSASGPRTPPTFRTFISRLAQLIISSLACGSPSRSFWRQRWSLSTIASSFLGSAVESCFTTIVHISISHPLFPSVVYWFAAPRAINFHGHLLQKLIYFC